MIFWRILFSILLVVLIATVPYWVYLPVLASGVVLFPFFAEGIVWAILIDVIYGYWGIEGVPFLFPIALGMVFLIIAVPLIRKRLRFHA